MTTEEKLKYITQDWLDCEKSYGFGHYISIHGDKLINMFTKTELYPHKKAPFSNDEILLVNLLYKLISKK